MRAIIVVTHGRGSHVRQWMLYPDLISVLPMLLFLFIPSETLHHFIFNACLEFIFVYGLFAHLWV